MWRLSRMGSHSTLARPSMSTWPRVGRSMPLVIFSAVVLPEPLRPSRTRVSPASTAKLTPASIGRPPISYDTSRNSTTLM